MEASHLIKPLGITHVEEYTSIDGQYFSIDLWDKSGDEYFVSSGAIFHSAKEAVKRHNEMFSKAPRVYGYE